MTDVFNHQMQSLETLCMIGVPTFHTNFHWNIIVIVSIVLKCVYHIVSVYTYCPIPQYKALCFFPLLIMWPVGL